jgi:hypothetical protein
LASGARHPGEAESATRDHRDANAEPLVIAVDASIRLRAEATPRLIVEALRRQLRRHDVDSLLRQAPDKRADLRLLRTTAEEYHLPQTLLGPLLDICRRNGLPYRVLDQRALVDCQRLHYRGPATESRTIALRQLLLRDCGVLVGGSEHERLSVAAELIARRQQRTLVLADESRIAERRRQLRDELGLASEEILSLDAADAPPVSDARLVLASYQQAACLPAERTHRQFGVMVFDELGDVDPVVLLTLLWRADARYLLGLAGDDARRDNLQGPLSFVLGGIAHRLPRTMDARAMQLAFRRRVTTFQFDYQGREQYQALLARLALDDERNRLIAQDLAREIALEHPCLVLSERRDHLDEIARQLAPEHAAVSETITSAVRPSEREAIVARFAKGDLLVLFVTGQIASDSLSLQRTRRLFIAFPFSYGRKLQRLIEQLIEPSEGKNDAIVYDYDDVQLAPLHRACEKRSKVIARLQRAADRAYTEWAQTELSF